MREDSKYSRVCCIICVSVCDMCANRLLYCSAMNVYTEHPWRLWGFPHLTGNTNTLVSAYMCVCLNHKAPVKVSVLLVTFMSLLCHTYTVTSYINN